MAQFLHQLKENAERKKAKSAFKNTPFLFVCLFSHLFDTGQQGFLSHDIRMTEPFFKIKACFRLSNNYHRELCDSPSCTVDGSRHL